MDSSSPTEAELLTSFLLDPARLPNILSPEQFRALFPRSARAAPSIRSLYLDLATQRGLAVDAVATAFLAPSFFAGAGGRLFDGRWRGSVAMRWTGRWTGRWKWTAPILPELDGAAGAVEAEIAKLRQQEADLRETIAQTIADLGDLRTGSLTNQQLPDEVLDGLENLQEICNRKT
ncbi:hypothetical protein BBAD15_g7207 [Beauveria bassiana D1-5]|uniref:Uncharacterized protein n=1 Tax=Beauveria bassiana D1-5 TaxID=1245745 RepID=A0A0A2VM65_BEABA|nr:hypothetical protein BBAD15_g7207 [Beauveria bassiana D1-5]